MKYRFLVITILLFLVICNSSEAFTIYKLPSGKEIKIIGIGKSYLLKDTNALTLKYETDIDIDNVDLLRKEVEEIWPIFRIDVEKSALSKAIIMATSPPIKKALILSTTRSCNFVATKRENGTWNLNSWKRDYDKETKSIAEKYLESSKKGDITNINKLFHYPDSFTSEQLNSEINGISKALAIISEKLGTISAYKLNNSKIVYSFCAVQNVSKEYWKKYPYLIGLIYDVKYSEKGSGYLVFRYSIIKDEVVINSISYGLPANNSGAEIIFKEINDIIMKEFSNT